MGWGSHFHSCLWNLSVSPPKSENTGLNHSHVKWSAFKDPSHMIHLSGTSGSCQHGAFSHFFRLFSTFGLMHQNVVTLGGGMCMLFEICKKTPFQKCMGWGGIGGHIFEYRGRTFRRFRVFGPQAAAEGNNDSYSDSGSARPENSYFLVFNHISIFCQASPSAHAGMSDFRVTGSD